MVKNDNNVTFNVSYNEKDKNNYTNTSKVKSVKTKSIRNAGRVYHANIQDRAHFLEFIVKTVFVVIFVMIAFYGISSADELSNYEFSSKNLFEYVANLNVPTITPDYFDFDNEDGEDVIYSDNKSLNGLIKTCSIIVTLVIYPIRLIIFFVNVLFTLPDSNILVYKGG